MKKLLLSFLIMSASYLYGMEPRGLSLGQRSTLKQFIQAEQSNDFNYYLKKSDFALQTIIQVAQTALDNNNEFKDLSKQLNIVSAKLAQILYNVISNAKKALDQSPSRKSKPVPSSEQVKAASPIKAVPIIKEMSLAENRVRRAIKGLSNSKDMSNYHRIQADKNLEAEYLFANSVLYDDEWVNEIKNEFGIPALKVKELLEKLRQQIGELLAERGYKNYADHFKKKEKQVNGPWPDYPDSPR